MKFTRRRAAGLMAASAFVPMPYIRRARAEDQALNVYNWADYIGETTIEDFQAATGISVTYDTYTSAEEMEAKMLAGSTGYDVVFMSALKLPNFIKAKVYQQLDRSKLAGWSNLDPAVMKLVDVWTPAGIMACPTCGERSALPITWIWCESGCRMPTSIRWTRC